MYLQISLLIFMFSAFVYSQEVISFDYDTDFIGAAFEFKCESPKKCVIYSRCDVKRVITPRFGEDECDEFFDLCCAEENIRETPIFESPTPPSKECGIRMVNGTDFVFNYKHFAEFGEFPWVLALLEDDNTPFCGATLIHPKVALTAWHCVFYKRDKDAPFKVRAGEWNLESQKEQFGYQERNVERIITHPKFSSYNLLYDFALLVLEEPFKLAPHINTICLPSSNLVSSNQNCISNGWGKNSTGILGKPANILKKIPLPIVSHEKCQQKLRSTKLGEYFKLHSSFICAGGKLGEDTCVGDGGSPLSCRIPGKLNQHYLAGLVSWGVGCNEERPAAYANVAEARDWIDSEMNKLELGTESYQPK